MRESPYKPAVHLFVCTNARPATDPLGAGCGPRGEEVFLAAKAEVRARGLGASVWVTRTHCLGICPSRGCAVASYTERGGDGGPGSLRAAGLLTEVEAVDLGAILDKTHRR